MLGITNFNPKETIHSVLNPFGLTISNKQPIINKLVFAAFAMLAINHALPAVTQGHTMNQCMVSCRGMKNCIDRCREIYDQKIIA